MESFMRRTNPKSLVVLAAALMAAGFLALPIGAGSGDLQVTGHSVVGNTVMVNVANSSDASQSGTLVVTVDLGLMQGRSTQAVRLSPRGQSTVGVSFMLPIAEVVSVSLSESGDPL